MGSTDQYLSEEQLVGLLTQGDSRAMGILYDRYAAALLGVISRIIQPQTAAEDVLQEVFVKIWKYRHQYQSSKGRLFTWMLRIARNYSIDVARSVNHRKQKVTDTIDLKTQKLGITRDKTDTIGVAEIVNRLAIEYRQVIELAYFYGHTQNEIAKKLNIPLGTVKSRVRIGLRELKKLMN
ncbi:MAG: sigma-70 family RNA polymerase sigma factor [Saprospiraceae bacterium]|nr:sigma-70 family RNA polymerase sigma factor [Saprospiraceae bacterium]